MATAILSFIIGAITIMIVMYVIGQGRRKAWERIALNLDFKLSGGAWPEGSIMKGKHKGREVLIREVETGRRARYRYTATSVTIDFNKDLPENIKIIHPGYTADFVNACGGQLIQTGNTKIDSALRLEGDDPEQIKSFIGNEHIYRAVAGFIQHFNDTAAIIEKSAIVCYRGFVRDEKILIDIMDRTVSVVEAIEKELT